MPKAKSQIYANCINSFVWKLFKRRWPWRSPKGITRKQNWLDLHWWESHLFYTSLIPISINTNRERNNTNEKKPIPTNEILHKKVSVTKFHMWKIYQLEKQYTYQELVNVYTLDLYRSPKWNIIFYDVKKIVFNIINFRW